jgi:uncharacterized protein YhdP
MPVRWRRASRNTLSIVLVIVALVLIVRALLPLAIQRYVNHVLDRGPTYTGRIGDLDLHLLRGACEIEGAEILKRSGAVPVPLFAVDEIDFSIAWRALLRGALVAEATLVRPQLNLVAGPTPERRQTGTEQDWRPIVEELLPIRIDRFEVRDGSVHFRDYHSEPRVDVYLRDIALVATNLTNSRGVATDRVAHLALRAVPMNAGRLQMEVALDPFAAQPDFDFDGAVVGADLTQWNDFLRAYAHMDVQRGTISLYGELLAHDGRFEGYLKPFLADVDVLRLEDEVKEQGWLASVWEALVGVTQEALEDQPKDRSATRIPISGTVESPEIGFWATLANVVGNAFVEGLVPQLEGSVGEH